MKYLLVLLLATIAISSQIASPQLLLELQTRTENVLIIPTSSGH